MDHEYYTNLPPKMAKRARAYLKEATAILSTEQSIDASTRAQLTVQLACGMMNLEAGEVISAATDNVADKIEERP